MPSPDLAVASRRKKLAPPEERALAREVARFVTAFEQPPMNAVMALTFIHAAFPGIKLETALAGFVFRKLLAKLPDPRVLQ
jgi:hypothetical protein